MYKQGRRKLFYGGGGGEQKCWSPWLTDDEKLKKKHWLKCPKAVPKKRNLNQNINDSKSHIWNYFFENIILGIQLFYIRPDIPMDIIRFFFNFRFSSRKSQSQQQLEKNITRFTIQFHSKNLTHFMNLNSLDIENNMLPQQSQKPF